jgi:hypothetical protein
MVISGKSFWRGFGTMRSSSEATKAPGTALESTAEHHTSIGLPRSLHEKEGEGMSNPICPKCQGEQVKQFESWAITDLKVTEPPKPMWACTEPTCQHKWPREMSD